MTKKQMLRILDANFNRSREGLRVCEEIARFVMNDKTSTKRIKALRHRVTRAVLSSDISFADLLINRNTAGDVGKKASRLENLKTSSRDIFLANIERVKEALRVLEEVSKLEDVRLSAQFKKIRFQAYAVEKAVVSKLEAIRHHRNC